MCKSTRTITNPRNGQSINTTCSDLAAAVTFANNAPADHWLHFWLHKYVAEMNETDYTDGMRLVNHMFLLSIGYGLKRPKIRIVFKGARYKLYLSQRGTLCIKSGERVGETDTFAAEQYVGCVFNGKFLANKERAVKPNEQEFLDELSADPIGFMARCSRDMGCCCYCNAPLDNEASKTVGYGPTCAKRWGLPWGTNVDNEKNPTFARLYCGSLADLMDEVLDRKDGAWDRFGDWLVANGLPRCKAPAYGTTLPRK